MELAEVFRQLDWTNETQRNRYQDVILEENAHMTQFWASVAGGLELVSRVK